MIHNNDNGVRLTTRETTSSSKRNGDTGKHHIRDNVIQEQPWNLDKMLSRYNYINNYPCPSALAPHSVIAQLRVPQDLITNGLTSAPFNNFIFWNGRVKVQFQITGSPMVQGCIAAVFIPLTSTQNINANQIKNFSSLSVNQTCYLFPNANTVAEMEIPFNSPQAYLNIAATGQDTINTLGHIYIVVFNSIALSAGTTDSVSVSVFSHFVDNQFKVPRRTTPAVTYVAQSNSTRPPHSHSSVVGKMADLLLPDNPLSDVIDMAAGFFGMDNPVDPTITDTNKIVVTQRMNFSQGPELIDKLCLNPSKTSAATSDTFASVTDEMSLSYLTKKYSYLGTFSMNTGDAVGDILASFPINPCPNRMTIGFQQQVPLLQYISMPFQLWKGGLNYKIQIVSTSFQTAKIFCSFNFNEFLPSPPSILPATTSQYGVAIEINQGSNTFEFSIPYVAITPELYVPNSNTISQSDTLGMVNISVINPLISPNGSPPVISFNIFVAGADDFELSNITAANNVIPVMNFPSPLSFKNVKLVQSKPMPDDFEIISCTPQSASQPLITPMSNVDMAVEDLVAPNDSTDPRADISQVSPFGFRDLMKKYHLFKRFSFKSPTPEQNGLVWQLPLVQLFGIPTSNPTVPPLASQPVQLLWHLIQPMFRQFKGSLNFKIMLDSTPDNSLQQFSVFYQPPTQAQGEGIGPTFLNNIRNQTYLPPTLAPLDYNQRSEIQAFPVSTRLPVSYVNSINKTAEINIPYSSRFLSVLSRSNTNTEQELVDNELTDLGNLFIYTDFSNVIPTNVQNTNFYFNVYFSFGDDARFGTLYNIPFLSPNSNIAIDTGLPTTSPYPDSYLDTAPLINTLTIS